MQGCSFNLDALQLTGHLSLVLPLRPLQDEHPAVSFWVWDSLCRHIRGNGIQGTKLPGDGENSSAVDQPTHDAPPGAGGAAGERGLVSPQDGQRLRRQRQPGSHC